MNLFLSKTWEHALLARVVKEAAEVAQKEGGNLGRTAIQKILYFLQVLNVPMRYRFDVHHYGPFSDSILGDVEWLTADEVIADNSPNPSRFSRFAPGRTCEDFLQQYLDKLNPYEETIRSTVKALLPLKPDHLELIATLDYSFREMKATEGHKPPKEKVIARFREFKGDKFQSEHIENTFKQLESAGLFS